MYLASNGSAKAFYQDESLFGTLAQHSEYLQSVEAYSLRIKQGPVLDVVGSL
jgi:hypothetical protein